MYCKFTGFVSLWVYVYMYVRIWCAQKAMKTQHFSPVPIDLRNCRHFLSLEAEFEDRYTNLRGERSRLDLHTLLRGPMGEANVLYIYIYCDRVGACL